MKAAKLLAFSAAILAAGVLHAQSPADPLIEPVIAPVETSAEIPGSETTQLEAPDLSGPAGAGAPAAPAPAAAGEPAAPGAPGAATPFAPLEQQKQDMKNADEGFIIKDAGLNDIFQFLAKSAGRQYFHNSKIAGPDYLVTGHLNDGKPLNKWRSSPSCTDSPSM